jgi:large subunit ribosomal protein L4
MAEVKAVELPVVNQAGEKVSTISVNGKVFGVKANKQAIHNAVVTYQANKRQATAKTKKRDEVSGGGRKPWKQKGTGRARAGSTRSPIWVGGGIVWGPTGEQNYKLQQNKKEHNLALRSALSLKVKKGLVVVDGLNFAEPKTKDFVKVLEALKVSKKVLIVVDDANESLLASARNVAGTIIVPTTNVSVYDLLYVDSVIITVDAIKKLEEALN